MRDGVIIYNQDFEIELLIKARSQFSILSEDETVGKNFLRKACAIRVLVYWQK